MHNITKAYEQKGTSADAHALSFLLAHFQHLLVDVTDHSFGLLQPVLVLPGVVARNVLP